MSTNAPDASDVPPEHAGLVDDATLLEPPAGAGVASLADAVARHRQRLAPGGMVGSLVVPDPVLPALAELQGAVAAGEPLHLTVVVSGGAGGIEPAAQWAARCPGTHLRALSTTLRDLDDLAGAARRTTTAAQQALDALADPDATRVSVGLPLEGVGRPGWLAALEEIAMADLMASFPIGGSSPVSPEVVVDAVDAALDREVPVRFTGPGGGYAPRTLLVVVRMVLDGETGGAVALLSSRDNDAARARATDLGSDALLRTRRWLRSVESLVP